MRVKTGYLLLLLIAGIANLCSAQTSSTIIRGHIFNPDNIGVDAATAILLNQADSSIVLSAITDNNGEYNFRYVKPGQYLIMATRLGYLKTYSPALTVSRGIDITLAPIILQTASNQLKEVAVVAKRPFVEIRPGKTIINPEASITADGKNALDILAQSPGVRVDNNDHISISGRQNALVLIDGKTTSMTGTDLAALLRSTQGSNIDRMELITGGSAKYDASAGGVINIILKKGKNIGTNGSINLGFGYGKYYKSTTGITFNNRSKQVNIFGSYSLIANKTYNTFLNDRNISFSGVNSAYNLSYNAVQDFTTHNIRLGADFSLSPRHTLGVLVYGFFNDNNFVKNNSLKIANQGHLDSTILVGSNVDRYLRNINYNINYAGMLGKSGNTLAANFTYSPYKRQSDEYISNRFFNAAGTPYRAENHLQNLSPSKRHNYTALLDYTQPLTKTAKLEVGAKFSHTESNNNLVFGPLVDGVYTINPRFSNRFVYNEDVSAGYINYINTFGKLDVTAGVRGEHTNSKGNSIGSTPGANLVTPLKYFNLFPNLLLHYIVNEKNEYALAFARGITRPDYESLNPFLYYIDPYNFQAGNPYLKPEYSNTLTLTHTYNQSITTSLYASLITDANFTYYRQNDTTKVNLTTSRNIGRVKSIGLHVNLPYTFTSWWSGLLDVDAAYLRYTVYPKNGAFDKGTADVIINARQNFNISKKLSLEISGRYETPNQYGIRRFAYNYYVNTGISTPVLNKKGKLSLTLSDLFNSNRDKAYTNFNNLDLNIYSKRETRIVRLNFSYRFGKTTVKGASSHVTGNEDEQNRMKKVSN
jgi:iron complex outermembrane receptor protein